MRLRVTSVLALLVVPTTLMAQARPQPAPGKPAEAVYKNIKALKGLPSEDLIPVMQAFRAAVGRDCTFCHKDLNDLAADTKEEKQTARDMIAMTKAINDTHFKGEQEVVCATCHQGRPHPSGIPPTDQEAIRNIFAADQARRQNGGAAPAQPPVAQIFDKYIQAIGGQAAVNKLTTRVAKLTTTSLGGPAQHGEAYSKAPNKLLVTQGQGANGFDGTKGWQKFGPNVHPASPTDTEAARASALFFGDLNPKEAYPQAANNGRDRVNGHDCWVVRTTVPNSKARERLYYDVNSGLLVRRIITVPTAFGPLATVTDYDDYKAFGGVKVATTIRRYDMNNIMTTKLTEVSFNTPVDDSKFAMPAAH